MFDRDRGELRDHVVDVGVARQVTAEIRDTGVGERDHPLLALLQCAEHADVGRRTDDVEEGFAMGSRFGFGTGSSDRNGNLQSDPRVSGSCSARSQQARSWAVAVSKGPATLVADRTASSPTRAAMSIAARCGVATDSAPSEEIVDLTVGDVRGNGDLQPPSDDGGSAQGRGGIAVRPRIEDIMSPTRSRVVLAATASSASPWGDATSSVSGTRSGTHNASMPASSHMRATLTRAARLGRGCRATTPRRASRARGARVGWKVLTRLHLFAMRTTVRWIDASIMVRR